MAEPAAKVLPRAVYALGAVSLLTDVASELIVPLLPLLLAQVGGSMVHLGLLQGISEGAVSLLKLASGWLSDRQRRRKPWMIAGYGVSALLRPLFAIVGSPWAMAAVRAGDRVGKGLRSAPRDALLADLVDAGQRGAAYGVQRAMDRPYGLLIVDRAVVALEHHGAVSQRADEWPVLAQLAFSDHGLPPLMVFTICWLTASACGSPKTSL